MNSNYTSEDLAYMCEYWRSLPIVKVVNSDMKSKIIDQNFRASIIKLLQRGINIQDNAGSAKCSIRHVLSAKEILHLMESQLTMSVKYPGLYFHLSKLEENDIITEVMQIKIKKNNVTYYGLTAKKFTDKAELTDISDTTSETPQNQNDQQNLAGKILVDMFSEYFSTSSGDISKELLSNVLEELAELSNDQPAGFNKWMEKVMKDSSPPREEIIVFLLELYRFTQDRTKAIRDLIDRLDPSS